MTVPTKPCASCGSPVADSALGRGAVENAAGQRYCSPCAAKLQNEAGPEAEAVKISLPRPSSAAISAVEEAEPAPAPPPPPPAPPPAPAPRKVTERRAAPRKETSRRTSVRSKKTGSKRAPARKNSSSRTKPAPARKKSSSRTRPARRRDSRREEPVDVGAVTGSSGRVSRRLSSKAALPWYFRITHGQWMGIGGGAVGLLLLILLICLLAGGDDRDYGPKMKRNPVPYGGNPSKAIGAAERLYLQGKKQEAIRLLEEAKQQAIRNGQDQLVLEINRKLVGLRFKTPN